MTYCGRCGAENPEESIFCWKCGAKLVKGMSSETVEDDPVQEEPSATVAEPAAAPAKPASESKGPELKPGYTMNDKDVVSFAGKTYDISAENRGQYRTWGLALVVLGYIIGFLMYFAYTIRYENEVLGSFSDSLFNIAIGDYAYDISGTNIVIILGVICLILTFIPTIGIISGLIGIIGAFMASEIMTVHNVMVDTVEIPYEVFPNAIGIFVGVMILYVIIMVAAGWCMSRYTMPYHIRKDATMFGSVKAFYMG